MKQIGFKNYKRFSELSPLDLGRVTVIVGANNSGKSTFLKGLLLSMENTVNLTLPQSYGGKERFDGFMHPVFSFDLNQLDAGISNFERSLNTDAKEQKIKFFISLPLVTESKGDIVSVDPFTIGFEVELTVQSDTKEDAERGTGFISLMSISDLGRQYYYNIDFVRDMVSLEIKNAIGKSPVKYLAENVYPTSKSSIFSETEEDMEMLRYTIGQYQNHGAETVFHAMFKLENHIRYRREEDGIITHSVIAKYVENIAETVLSLISKDSEGVSIEHEQKNFLFDNRCENDGSTIEDFFEARNLIKFNKDTIRTIKDSAKALDEAIMHEERIMYLPIHSIDRHVLYNANDKNDFIAQSIRNYMFASANRNKKREMKKLVKQLMQMFEIGEDFSIKIVEGEYYSLKVYDANKKSINLADLGTGAIQLIVLFLNIATIIDHNTMKISPYSRERGTYANIPTIIIEEPEQNLHPKFQSRLADLFAEISLGLNVVVETHSEYLVRRIQVIQSNAYKESQSARADGVYTPFKIYYFPNDGQPYDMKIRYDGKFKNDFGPGFFDVATDLAFEIL